MAYQWPSDTPFTTVTLDVEDPSCPSCAKRMHICDHRTHKVHSFRGPLRLVNRLVRCPDPQGPAHHRTFSSQAEGMITMPWWVMDWEVFAWIGHRRFARHWWVPQLRAELADSHHIALSEDAIEKAIGRYQTMLAARERDPRVLAEHYSDVLDLVLSIDGIQPEKGHETLYVVRELRRRRVWFAESLISSSEAEVRRLLVQAREWAEQLHRPVRLWISDKQEAFVTGVAAVFPGVVHRYCDNHFLRDLAQPVLERDAHAKVQMRRKVRGLRAILRDLLQYQAPHPQDASPHAAIPDRSVTSPPAPPAPLQRPPTAPCGTGAHNPPGPAPSTPEQQAQQIVLDYCTAVRGILNSDQGGPLHPPGLRMADSLQQVRDSLQRNREAKKGALQTNPYNDSWAVSIAGCPKSRLPKPKSASISGTSTG
jgi:hypothetical protein